MIFTLLTLEEEASLLQGGLPYGVQARTKAARETDVLETEDHIELCGLLMDLAESLLENPSQDWDLSTRARNVLLMHKFTTVYDLRLIPTEKILRLSQCGLTTISEIVKEGMTRGHNLVNWYKAVQKIQHYKYGVKAKARARARSDMQEGE